MGTKRRLAGLMTSVVTCMAVSVSARGAAMHEVATASVRPAGAPEYADVCFRYGWTRADGPASVDNAKKAIRAFHATRVDWFYPGSHTAVADTSRLVTPQAKAFIEWCKANDVKVGGAINSNTTEPAWGLKKIHFGRFLGDPSNPDYVAGAVAWGKAQIDAGVDTLVCDDIFKYNAAQAKTFSDKVIEGIKAHKAGFTIAGNNGGFIGTRYVKAYAFDFHYSDNNYLPSPGRCWAASREHRGLGSAFLLHPNRPRTTAVHRQMIALAYAAGGHVITPWDEYIHGGERLFADPADFADIYGFARALGQQGYLNGYEDAAVGGYDLKETRYGTTPPITVSGGSGKLSVFGRAKPGGSATPVVLHLVESAQPKAATVRLRIPALFGTSKVNCTLLSPPAYVEADHGTAAASGDYAPLARATPLTPTGNNGVLVIHVPPMTPWGALIISPARGG